MKKFLKIVFFFTVLLSFLGLGIIYKIKKETNVSCYSNVEKIPFSKVGIIFGAGIKKNNTPSKYLRDRLNAGILLFKNKKIQKILLSGDNGSINYDELVVMKEYCTKNGIDSSKIYLDYAGFDTYSTLYRAKSIFKVDTAILVSQNYHLDRAIYLGESFGIKSYGFDATNGKYYGYKKNQLREYLAILKSYLDVKRKRKPKYLGEIVTIDGPSNYTKILKIK